MTNENFEVELREATLEYASAGWPIFTCVPNEKRPLTKNGFKDASSDPEQVARWLAQWPNANVATPTGEAAGADVLDVDVKEGAVGDVSLAKLVAEFGPLPKTWTQRTPSGGVHYFFRPTAGLKTSIGKLAPGIDVKAEGGYVLIPPSVIDGNPYVWEVHPSDCPLADMPQWLIDKLMKLQERTEPKSKPPLSEVKDGARNEQLWLLGRSMRARGATEVAIGAAMRVANEDFTPPYPLDELERLIANVLRQPDRPDYRGPRPTPEAEQQKKAEAGPAASDDDLQMDRGDQIEVEEVEFAWPGRIPLGYPTWIVGDPGDFKTGFSVGCYAATVSRGGGLWPDGQRCVAKPESTLYFSSEDDSSTVLLPRFIAAGGDRSKIFFEKQTGEGKPLRSLETDVPRLERLLLKTGAKHLVVDPVNSYLPRVNTWKDSDLRSAMTPLTEMTRRLRVVLLGIVHLNKASDRKAIHRVMGTVGMGALVRACYLIAPDPESPGRRLFLTAKYNIGQWPANLAFSLETVPVLMATGKPVPSVRMLWEGAPLPASVTADSILNPPERGKDRPVDRAARAILDKFTESGDAPVLEKEMQKALAAIGAAERTVDRAKKRVCGVGIRYADGPWYWTPRDYDSAQRDAWMLERRAEVRRAAGGTAT